MTYYDICHILDQHKMIVSPFVAVRRGVVWQGYVTIRWCTKLCTDVDMRSHQQGNEGKPVDVLSFVYFGYVNKLDYSVL